MDLNIEEFVQKCEPCQAAAKAHVKVNLHSWPKSSEPWQRRQAERFVDTFKRAFRKLKGEGLPNQEIIETFLITYRTTPNDSLPNLKSPAEMLLGRKPRTTFDLLKPPPFRPLIRDLAMEEKFNKRFGTKSRKFGIGDKIFARHRSSENWRAGVIKRCSGVIFDVKFPDGSKSRFHANQLRNRQNLNNGDEALAILNDAFALPLPPAQANEVPAADPPADDHEGNGIEDQGIVPPPLIEEQVQRRYPPRQRRAPIRYSPS